MRNQKIFKLVMASLFTAMTCVATIAIRLPSFGANGYINLGDTLVLLSAWLLGGGYGAMAAGLGSALADILSGYTYYAPGTFIIKFLMALLAVLLYTWMNKGEKRKPVARIVSAAAAEMLMITGYFIYEAAVLGYGVAALTSVVSNLIQGLVCAVIGILVMHSLEKTGIVKHFRIDNINR